MIDIQKIAREAGFFLTTELKDDPRFAMLKRFAALYREALIAELVAGSGEPVAWMISYEGKCMGFMPHEGKNTVPIYAADQLAGAVLRERQGWMDAVKDRDAIIKQLSAAAIRGQQ